MDAPHRCVSAPVRRGLHILLLVLACTGQAHADAIVRSQAMRASTIAEIFVVDGALTVELEIGIDDLEAFRNLLPDQIYQRLGRDPEPLAERLPRFYAQNFVIAAEAGEPLAGRVALMEARPRNRRDDVTGEPLAAAEDEEIVVFTRIEYVLPERPATLFLGTRAAAGARAASVGFVVYHRGIAVNDFRYLGPSQLLMLDWNDPWYTRFEHRGLRRANFAPMSGFIYVEPYEVRKEIVLRPVDLQHWVDLGLAGRETIPVEIQGELKRRVAEFLRGRHVVTIDGDEITPELARVNFLERTLRTSRVIDPPVELDIFSALLGIIFVYPTDGLPQRVTMDWDLWSDRIQQIPASSVDQAGPLPTILEPDFRVLEWQNFLRFPVLPTLEVLAPPPGALARALLWLRWLVLAGALASIAAAVRRSGRSAIALTAVTASVLTAGCFWLSQSAALTDARARAIVSGLLHNVYRAFDFRGEEQIYDVLAKSADGDLLAQIYLETRRGLELASQGGARAKVKQVELVDLETEPADAGAFTATATWNVAGSVGHWGHIHSRSNRYRATLTIAPIDGSWKLTSLQVLEEQRL